MARTSKKMVVVDVYTDWCGWCKRLDREVYSAPSIGQLVGSKFVPLKLDAEDGGEGETFAKKWKIRGYPCTVVMDSTGTVKGMFYGYKKISEFPEELFKTAGIALPPQM